MVKTNKSLNLALAVLFAALVLYLGFALLRRSQSGYTTAQAVMVTVNETGQAEGVVVREEQVLRSSKTHVAVYVNEGAEVRAGGEVAVESDSEKTLEDAARVRQLDTEIEYLRSLLSAADQAVGAMEHDTAVKNAIYQASAAVNARSTASLDNACVTLSSLLLSTGADVTQSDLDALMAERRQLSAETNEGVITAPAAGVFTAAVDGLESLTPDRLDDLTPADVRGLSKQQESVSKDAFGKLITAKKWYYAAVMRAEDAARLTVGAETTLDFGRHSADALRATVKSISEPVNGEVAVVFTVKSGLAETAALRETGCEIVFSSHTGLRVPVRAIRFIDGEKGKVPVVYVITAERMEMKYVEILYRSDDFVILDRGTGKNALRAGNEVIVDGKELEDGKAISR